MTEIPTNQTENTQPSYEDARRFYGPIYDDLLQTEYAPDGDLPESVRPIPHDIISRMSVKAALAMQADGTYQRNIDIPALARTLGDMTLQVQDVDDQTLERMLSLQSVALGSAFTALLDSAMREETGKLAMEKMRNAMQAQRQSCQAVDALHLLRQERMAAHIRRNRHRY